MKGVGKKVGRILAAAISVVAVALLSFGCKPSEDYREYFENFSSVGTYTKAEQTLSLPENTFIDSYDPLTGYYITSYTYTFSDDVSYTMYGIVSEDGEVNQDARFLSVLGLRKDYAIVTRLHVQGGFETQETRIGVVKLRGANAGTEYGFSYAYAPAVSQYQFAGDGYLVVHGDLKSDTSDVNYATVYDLTVSAGPMEIARAGGVTTFHKHFIYNNNLLSCYQNSMQAYRLDEINSDGYLRKPKEYAPFTEADGFSETSISVRPYYVGGDWFIVTGIYTSTTEYDGYEIKQLREEEVVYMTVRSVKYNARTGGIHSTYRVLTVANSYTDSELRAVADTFNSADDALTDDVGLRLLYAHPVVSPASFVKRGYSIAYYYYFSDGLATVSFELLDENCNSVNIDNIFMPVLYVDGVGIQTADPTFSIPLRSFEFYFYDSGKKSTVRSLESSVGYDPWISYGKVIIGSRVDLSDGSVLLGAIDEKGNQILPFRYYEITPYFGEYATASIFDSSGGSPVRRFYRVDRSGRESEISNVYGLFNGVYMTNTEDGYRLYANDGSLLLDAHDSLKVLDQYLVNGVFLEKRVIGVIDGHGVAYRVLS